MRGLFHDVRVVVVIGLPPRRCILMLIGILLLSQAACGSAARQPGGSSGAALSGGALADVLFVRGMIPHHAQALEMTGLVAERTGHETIRRLAGRIEVSQRDEIALMERWLERRGEALPAGHDHGPLMPGMLTEQELARLREVSGAEFDRLFLELMIGHHEGALVMVADLFADGGGQEPELFRIASHIDADQRAEIARMRTILRRLDQEGNE